MEFDAEPKLEETPVARRPLPGQHIMSRLADEKAHLVKTPIM